MWKRWNGVALLLAIALAPAWLVAQAPAAPADDDGLLLRVQGPVHVRANETASTVVVIGDRAVVDGTVAGDLIVINGVARVAGVVQGNVTVANGHLELVSSARVGQNVLLYHGTLDRAPEARVAGTVHEEIGFSFARLAWLLWFGITFLIVVAGLVFVVLAERQLQGAARLILTRPGPTVLSALAVVVGLPMLAMSAMLTGIGIPLGLALLVFLLPAVALLGYLVAGASVGRLVLRRWPQSAEHSYFSIAVGLLILQVIGLIPALGGLLLLLASQLGAGALAYRSWRIRGGSKLGRAPAAQTV